MQSVAAARKNITSGDLIKYLTVHDTNATAIERVCPYCGKGHLLYKCLSFQEQSAQERKDFVLKNRICFFCLRKGYFVKDCKLKGYAKFVTRNILISYILIFLVSPSLSINLEIILQIRDIMISLLTQSQRLMLILTLIKLTPSKPRLPLVCFLIVDKVKNAPCFFLYM